MRTILVLLLFLSAVPALARDRLGAWQSWAAFRDAETARCYAIGGPEETNGSGGFVAVGFWPKRGLSHQVYVRLSRNRSTNSGITLSAGGRRFQLAARGNSGWAKDRQMDLAIIAAIRIGRDGRNITDASRTRGAASAIDAAALGCLARR